MAAKDYYQSSQGGYYYDGHDTSAAPTLPPLHTSQYTPLAQERPHESPLSPVFNQPSLQHSRTDIDEPEAHSFGTGQKARPAVTSQYSDEIPLREHSQGVSGYQQPSGQPPHSDEMLPALSTANGRKRGRREKTKKGFFSGRFPWVCWIFTAIQTIVFIVELVKNGERSVTSACDMG